MDVPGPPRLVMDEIHAFPPPTACRSGFANVVVSKALTCSCSPAKPTIPPLPDEIAVIICVANRGRLNARVGGLKFEDVKGEDGLV